MVWIILGIVVFIIIALMIQVKNKTGNSSQTNEYAYTKQDALFSPAERSFLGVLQQAIGSDAQIFGKVRVADVITPKKGATKSDWQKAFNKISGKHFDFILCNKEDLSIICAIELDDASHNSKTRQKRDQFLEEACKSSSLPLIQIPAKSSYNINEIRALFSTYLM